MLPLQLGGGRGALIEIFPDSTAETIWSSGNESIFGLAVRNDHVLFTTDSNGRIFDLDAKPDGEKLTILTETHESLATRLLLGGSGPLRRDQQCGQIVPHWGFPRPRGHLRIAG